jgi:hypothetical protein
LWPGIHAQFEYYSRGAGARPYHFVEAEGNGSEVR